MEIFFYFLLDFLWKKEKGFTLWSVIFARLGKVYSSCRSELASVYYNSHFAITFLP